MGFLTDTLARSAAGESNGNGGWMPGAAQGALGGLTGGMAKLGNGLMGKNKATMPHYEDDRKWLEELLKNKGQGPYIPGQSPYQQNYGDLISTLTARANGQGPSVAGTQFQQASAQNMNQAASLAAGSRSAGAARQAQTGIQQMGQGLAHGYAQARNAEMLGATQQLGQTLNGADNAAFQRERANQMAWLEALAQQLGLSKAQMQASVANSQQPSGLQQLGGLAAAAGPGLAKLRNQSKNA